MANDLAAASRFTDFCLVCKYLLKTPAAKILSIKTQGIW